MKKLIALSLVLLIQCGCGNNPKNVSRNFAHKLILSSVDDVVTQRIDEAKKAQHPMSQEDIVEARDYVLGGILSGDSDKVEDIPSGRPITDDLEIGEDTLIGSVDESQFNDKIRDGMIAAGLLSRTIGGPVTENWNNLKGDIGRPIQTDKSQFISVTEKGKPFVTGCRDSDKTFSNGLKGQMCDFPKLTTLISRTFVVNGVSQDGNHADVHVLVTLKWQLTPLAKALRDVAKRFNDTIGYESYNSDAWYRWLGSSPDENQRDYSSIIHFQRFDDGWRIVDKAGNSLKDMKK